MTSCTCQIDGCNNPLPPDGIVCLDCHSLLTRQEFGLLVSTRMAARRAHRTGNEERSNYLRSQFASYLKISAKHIDERKRMGGFCA